MSRLLHPSIPYIEDLIQMEQLFERDTDRAVVLVGIHDVGHHVPPLLRNGIYVGRILAVGFLGALLIGKEQVGLAIPEDAVVADTLIFGDHFLQFRPDGSVTFGILLLASGLEIHLKSKSFHIRLD